MKAWSLVFGYFVINLAIWTLNLTGLFAVGSEPIVSPSNMNSLFSLDVFTGVAGAVGGGIIMILGLMTRNAALSTGALLLWIVAIILRPLQDIVLGLPKLMSMIFAAFGPTINYIFTSVFVALSGLMLFIFVVEILAGREIWG